MEDLTPHRRGFALGALGIAATALAPKARAQQAGGWRILPTEAYRGKQDDISFISLNEGWYGNGAGKLYRTRDGGETWTQIWERPGTFIRALGFVDAQNGFLGNVGTGYYPNVADDHPLYRTRDGGETWTRVEAENISAVRGVCSIDILHEQRIYQGELRDNVVVHAAGRVGGPAAMLRSLDGGETWRVLDLSRHAGMILDVKFFSAHEGLVCAASSADTTQANALILRTADGGETWTEAHRSARLYENCWKMSFPSREVGYATVQNYQEGATERLIVKTTDGGATWRELPLVADASVREFGIGFVDNNWGWVGAIDNGFETRDGGATWAPIDFGRAVNKILIVRDRGAWRAFAIGVNVARLDG
jgi:photosystem II stability/assembly factor-like uncharacterized protein